MHRVKVLRFGLDYLKYNFLHNHPQQYKNKEFASQFIGLSENSNETEAKLLGYRFQGFYSRHRTDSIIHFHHNGHRVLLLKKWNGTDQVGSRMAYSFDFYSSFFTFPELKPFIDKFRHKYGHSARVARIDIACDLNIAVKDFMDAGFETRFKKVHKYGESLETGESETVYFGKKTGLNKRHLIRVYNKLLDTTKKKKFALYKDYFSYTNVTRVEVEVRSVTCKEMGITNEDIMDQEVLKSIFTTLCMNPRTTYFHALEALDLESTHIRKLSSSREKKIMAKEDRVKRVIGMSYNLHADGYPNIVYHVIEGMRDRGAYQNSEELQLLQKTINNYTIK